MKCTVLYSSQKIVIFLHYWINFTSPAIHSKAISRKNTRLSQKKLNSDRKSGNSVTSRFSSFSGSMQLLRNCHCRPIRVLNMEYRYRGNGSIESFVFEDQWDRLFDVNRLWGTQLSKRQTRNFLLCFRPSKRVIAKSRGRKFPHNLTWDGATMQGGVLAWLACACAVF